ncbi:MAG: lipid A deacylase LpxR family protein [Lacibacter sp.]|jgi:lipid A 3-O-deacylase
MKQHLFSNFLQMMIDSYFAGMKQFLLSLCFICFSATLKAQKPFRNELMILTENDNYDLELTDRYYSNGFIVQYNRLAAKHKETVLKKIHRAELAHKVYNPVSNRRSSAEVLAIMDRPFAGWLSASYGANLIYKSQHILQYQVTAGIMGPAAAGRQIQQGWHKLIGLYKVYGWEYQLNNEAGLNVAAEYYHSLVSKQNNSNTTVHLTGKASVGNTFTNAAAGILLKTGKLLSEENSHYWNAGLGRDVKTTPRHEFVFFAEPLIQYQLYNATVQGGLFRSDKGPFTTALEPFVFQAKTGFMFNGNRAGIRWYYTFRTREGKAMRKGEHWGSIGVTLRF